jgi:hypothetical protein
MDEKEKKFINDINTERIYNSDEQLLHFKNKIQPILKYLRVIYDMAIENEFNDEQAMVLVTEYFIACFKAVNQENTNQ